MWLNRATLRARALVVTTTFAVVLAACGSSAHSGAAPPSGGSTTAGSTSQPIPTDIPRPGSFTIVTTGTQFSGLFGVAFAASAGPLVTVGTSYGTNIKLQTVGSGQAAVTALTSGGADMCFCSTPRVLAAVEAGQGLVSVFNPYFGNTAVLVGAKKYETSIGPDVSKYGDKKWALVAEGGSPAAGAKSVAKVAGLDWAKVKRVITGDDAALIPTLQSGQADLVVTDPGPAANAVALGVGYVVRNLLDPATMKAVSGDLLGIPATVRDNFVAKYPQFTQAVVTAFVQSLAALRVASGPQALALMPKDFQASRAQKTDVWNEEWKLTQPAMEHADGTFPPNAVTNSLQDAKNLGTISTITGQMNSAFNSTFVSQAYKDLAIPRPGAG